MAAAATCDLTTPIPTQKRLSTWSLFRRMCAGYVRQRDGGFSSLHLQPLGWEYCLTGVHGQGLDMEKCKNGGKPWVGEPLYASQRLRITSSVVPHACLHHMCCLLTDLLR